MLYHVCVCVSVLSHVQLFAIPWSPLGSSGTMEFSRQEYWSGLPFPILGDLPNPGIEPACPVSASLQVDSLTTSPTLKPYITDILI